jgi:hypothetical protein
MLLVHSQDWHFFFTIADPNPSDPLNGEAAGLLLKDPLAYEQKVKEMVAKHASAFAVAKLMTKHDSSLEGQREVADQNDDLGAEAYVSSDEENEDPRRETNAKRARWSVLTWFPDERTYQR